MTGIVYPADAVGGAPSYTGRVLRNTQMAALTGYATAARPLGAHSGVRPGTPSSIITVTSTTWTVTPFAGLIDAESAAAVGPYAYAFQANQTGSITAAAGSARYDRLDVQISDPAEADGSTNPLVTIIYTAGTPGAGVIPAAPARSHLLTTILVPASGGGAPTVIYNPQYSSSAGGAIPFNNTTELFAVTNAGPSQLASTLSDSTNIAPTLWMWDGSNWQRLAQANATATISTFGTNWSAGTSAQVPRVTMVGDQVFLTGTVLFGASGGSYANILTIPTAFQPPNGNTRFIGTSMTSTGLAFGLGLSTGVVGSVAGYSTGSLGFSTRVTLNCNWRMD